VLLLSSFSGILIGGCSLLIAKKEIQTRIPFGPFLALGALGWLFFSRELQILLYGIGR
jgi:leader peptidase (prepilin peptidase)/N-methyltransferase